MKRPSNAGNGDADEGSYSGIFFNGLHLISLVFILVMTIVIMSIVLPAEEAKNVFHAENTILSKYDSDSVVNTYIPVSKPPTEDDVSQNFYSCLLEAEVAVDNVYNCPTSDILSYRTCLARFTDLPSKVRRMLALIRNLLGEYNSGDLTSTEFQNLPSWLTSVDITTLNATLYNNVTRLALKQQLAAQATPLSVRVLDIITKSETMSGLQTCTDTVTQQVLTEYSLAYDLSTAFDRMWKCASDIIITNPIQKRAFDRCIPLTAWPAKDVVQTAYTDTLLGSYNKYFVGLIGAWLLTSFAVYTAPGWHSKSTVNGKPEGYLARAGKGMVVFGFLWNLVSIVIVLVRGFMPASNFNNAPMSIQTVFLTLFFTISTSIYFGREVYELYFLSKGKTPSIFPKITRDGTSTRYINGQKFHAISAFMVPPSDLNMELPDERFTPLVTPVWNDAFVFVDVLLFLAMAGTTIDTVTIDLTINVLCILGAALTNSALVRLLYEGYIKDVSRFAPNRGEAPPQLPIFVLRVMSVSAGIMGLLFGLIVVILVGMRFQATTLTWYVSFSLLFPQVLWLVYWIVLEMYNGNTQKHFFRTLSALFSYNVIIRAVFLIFLVTGIDYEYKATVGDSDSIKGLLAIINTESSTSLSYLTY